MLESCNSCRRGFPEFTGTIFKDGRVYHRYNCVWCGNQEMRLVNPFGFDVDDPRAKKTLFEDDRRM